MALVDESMFTEGKTVVAHVHDHCVFPETICLNPIDNTANTFVDCHQGFKIKPVELIEFNCAVIHVIHSMPAIALLSHPGWNIAVVNSRCGRCHLSEDSTTVSDSEIH